MADDEVASVNVSHLSGSGVGDEHDEDLDVRLAELAAQSTQARPVKYTRPPVEVRLIFFLNFSFLFTHQNSKKHDS